MGRLIRPPGAASQEKAKISQTSEPRRQRLELFSAPTGTSTRTSDRNEEAKETSFKRPFDSRCFWRLSIEIDFDDLECLDISSKARDRAVTMSYS